MSKTYTLEYQRKILELFDKHLAEEKCNHKFDDVMKEVWLD